MAKRNRKPSPAASTASNIVPIRKDYAIDNWGTISAAWGVGQALIRRIGEAQALRQSALTAALDVLQQDIGKVTLRLYRGFGDDREVVPPSKHPWAYRLALGPNKYHRSWGEIVGIIVGHGGLHQKAYFYKKRRNMADTEPDLIPVHPDNVNMRVAGDQFFFDVTAGEMGMAAILGFQSTTASKDDILHFRFRNWSGIDGLSTLLTGGNVLGINEMMTEFQAVLTQNGTKPSAVISVPETLSDDAFQRLKIELQTQWKKVAAEGRPMIVEQGAQVSKLSWNAAEMDLVRAKTQLHQEVARLLRMPPYKIGLLESVKAENLEQMERVYVDDTLVPITKTIGDTLTAGLLSEEDRLDGLYFAFDPFELYNRDFGAALDRIENQFKIGMITRGQATARIGYGRVAPHLDHYLVPVNVAIQQKDGTIEYVTPNAVKPDTNSDNPQADSNA